MAESTNRTLVCSVLYLDIVDFSRRPIEGQIWLKERFNAALTEATAGVGAADRIVLDTGGGASLTFLGDPEDALFSGLSVRDALATQVSAAGLRARIRAGINIGPVRLAIDLNGQAIVIGHGINAAKSIMRLAEPGQILVSRSYYQRMTVLSESHADLFHYEGAKTDEDLREYEVYAVSAAPSRLSRNQGAKTDDARRSPGWTAAIVAWMRKLLR